MAQFTRLQVALTMGQTGLVPVFYHTDAALCERVLRACYEGGARVFEFTNRGDFAHETFAHLVRFCASQLPGLMLGIGSVVEPGTAALYLQLGANFVVSPAVHEDVARTCHRRKVLWIPGCGSVNEISQAEALGAEVVKMFPGAQVGGPKFVAAVKGPCPWTSIMPTGGVEPTEESLKAWFEAGVYCVGMGSQLVTSSILQTGNFAALADSVRQTLAIIAKYKRA
ncbi:MAG: bifunctional 4-hydroxy-2-oxoglutarate aldolase/2-dehydro-3-deoxy-phosphogluconate aldolase [Bernardetiaceae bacterium]|jgi:2-dehydro-3-deoxyphosphogluconate aldolase/(4S)-4-hydroxy-2-oxoglutarate aldolase|nr:bifunctional 4-hydroxy-2-oxoglutarate aldolase/2-dehydro-3-deoxy-phosphogluconate aldolase [Bernardetiaceae bacterium]